MKKVAFHTLGCKLNFAETSTIGRLFTEQGFVSVELGQRPHVFVINTCSVTGNADHKCRKLVQEALRVVPDVFIVVIGCYAQLKPKEIALIPGVNAVLGTYEKFKLLSLITDFEKKSNTKEAMVHVTPIQETTQFTPAYSLGQRTRTFLKVQDGCNYKCTFCTIPLARGKSRSTTVQAAVDQADQLAQQGVQEIVLTGINLGDFGRINDQRTSNFLTLVQALDQLKTVGRFRISSIEPNLLDHAIIDFVSHSDRFTPHFHIPLQSGSDRILKLMRRRYLTELYHDRIAYIKEKIAHCCIGVDVIVGFPGETEEDFLATYHFLHQLPIAYLHVFPYSERANTAAATMDGIVPQKERIKRARMLRTLSEKKLRQFYQEQLGKVATVLLEFGQGDDPLEGFTENYIRVKLVDGSLSPNAFYQVTLTEVNADGVMLGKQVSSKGS